MRVRTRRWTLWQGSASEFVTKFGVGDYDQGERCDQVENYVLWSSCAFWPSTKLEVMTSNNFSTVSVTELLYGRRLFVMIELGVVTNNESWELWPTTICRLWPKLDVGTVEGYGQSSTFSRAYQVAYLSTSSLVTSPSYSVEILYYRKLKSLHITFSTDEDFDFYNPFVQIVDFLG